MTKAKKAPEEKEETPGAEKQKGKKGNQSLLPENSINNRVLKITLQRRKGGKLQLKNTV
ncbi:hypothetical protein [Oceanispirochaeta sp.]|jgi:hypothetical protein|uniref:hypothetical protein n=1 Tax=Oceanispirochaeta sp. TaxID=2035350 RepID=UPI002621A87F|nr:hypothetical protein [Oceanispirochaeta sp.]MDA3958333.1 hypothetical protein [Oceanispirochaeta sp.]